MSEDKKVREEMIYGKHPIENLIETNPGQISTLFLKKDSSNWDLAKKARKKKISVHLKEADFFKNKFRNINHQGMVAFVNNFQYKTFADLVNVIRNGACENIIFADSITDPHNFGAIIRSAHLLEVNWIIIPHSNSVGVTDVVAKTSAGASSNVNIVRLQEDYFTLVDTIHELGMKIISLDASGETYIEDVDLENKNFMLVTGGEHTGINYRVIKNSDYIAKLRMDTESGINSYNTSVAMAIALYTLTGM